MNELKPLSYSEAEIVIDYLKPRGRVIEFKHPLLGDVFVEQITYAPFPEPDYKDFIKEVHQSKYAFDTWGSFWGHTYRVVVIVDKLPKSHLFRTPEVFTIQELQEIGIIGFDYPEDIFDDNFDDDYE